MRRCRLTRDETLGDPSARRALDALHAKTFNFEASDRQSWTKEAGWRTDHYCQALPAEAPGPPEPDGTWERARRLMRDYEFADPKIVQAIYRRDAPLEGRDMLLVIHFWGLRFRVGVRVGGVIDETREVGGDRVRVWGWNYATLQGHLETGQMDYEVWKWTGTGAVEFRINVVSRAGRIRNPIIRLGFHLFGRREQVRFAKRACERMACLVAEEGSVRTAGEIEIAPG